MKDLIRKGNIQNIDGVYDAVQTVLRMYAATDLCFVMTSSIAILNSFVPM